MDCPFIFATAPCLQVAQADDGARLWVGLLVGLFFVVVAGVMNELFLRSLDTLSPEEREEALRRWREPLL